MPTVMHVIDSLDLSGGAEKQLIANLQSFDKDLLSHEIVTVEQARDSRESEVPEDVAITSLFDSAESINRVELILRLHRLVEEKAPDLIHAYLPNAALAARVVGRSKRIRYVESLVTISHEPIRTIDNPKVNSIKLLMHRALDRLTMRSAIGYHAVSRAVADSWARTVGLDEHRIRVIPRGIELNAVLRPAPREVDRRSVRDEFGLDTGSKIVLSVGRVEPAKGHRYLVESLPALAAEHPDVHLLIVGRPGAASQLLDSTIRRLGVTESVELAGPRTDIPRLLAAADVFAFPSLFEGNGGNAMIEAMAARVPIVTTNAEPMTDLIPDERFGLLVPMMDPPSLSQAIGRLLGDEDLRTSLTEKAYARVSHFPTHTDLAHEYEEWYSELLDQGRD